MSTPMEGIKIGEGSRLNTGKIRMDLLEPFAQEQKARVFTKGAMKYAPNNWLHGMDWSKCYASAMRHILAWARGEDYDIDPACTDCQNSTREQWICKKHTGELHSALAAWNWDAITSYYKWYPQGDDRLHLKIPQPKIGLDIDEVICNWVSSWCKLYEFNTPTSWYFDGGILDKFQAMRDKGTLDDFYANLEPMCKPTDIPFEPHCYVTSRPVKSEITVNWLKQHGFPIRPVITIESGTSKIEAIKKAGVDIFVDDRYDNFEELNRNGICCYLFDAPHNHRYDVGYRRIYSLKDLKR